MSKTTLKNSVLVFVLAAGLVQPVFGQTNETGPAKWLAVLQSGSSTQKDKADACRELARVATKDAVPVLSPLLADEAMSHMARYAMETIPGPEVDQAFRDALGRLKGRPLIGVIGSIGVRRDERAVGQLSKFLDDSDPLVVQTTARTLGKIGGPDAVKALQANLSWSSESNALAVCEGLLKAADSFAADGHMRQAMEIFDSLGKVNAPHQVRTAAFRGSVLTRGKQGIPMLMDALQSSNWTEVEAAIRVAQQLKVAELTAALTKALDKLPADKQVLVLQTLGQRGDPQALPAILSVTRKSDSALRVEALRAAARLQDTRALPVFVDLVEDKDPAVGRAAQDGLGAMPGSQADAAVLKMVNSSNPTKQTLGMELVSRRRMTAAVPVLFKAASSANQQVRTSAIRRIGDLATPGDMPGLIDLLMKGGSQEDIEAAEHGLETLCSKTADKDQCVSRISSRLGNATPAQKSALLRVAASAGGPKALEVMRTELKDPNPEVHATALRALGTWNTAEAAPDLLQIARTSENSTDKMVALRGYLGLIKLSDLSEQERLRMCREVSTLVQKPEEKRLLLAGLGDLASPGAVSVIVPYLEDGSVKEEAANAIVGISDRVLKRNDAASNAAELVGPLEQVADKTSNTDLAQRAKKLASQAQAKAKK